MALTGYKKKVATNARLVEWVNKRKSSGALSLSNDEILAIVDAFILVFDSPFCPIATATLLASSVNNPRHVVVAGQDSSEVEWGAVRLIRWLSDGVDVISVSESATGAHRDFLVDGGRWAALTIPTAQITTQAALPYQDVAGIYYAEADALSLHYLFSPISAISGEATQKPLSVIVDNIDWILDAPDRAVVAPLSIGLSINKDQQSAFVINAFKSFIPFDKAHKKAIDDCISESKGLVISPTLVGLLYDYWGEAFKLTEEQANNALFNFYLQLFSSFLEYKYELKQGVDYIVREQTSGTKDIVLLDKQTQKALEGARRNDFTQIALELFSGCAVDIKAEKALSDPLSFLTLLEHSDKVLFSSGSLTSKEEKWVRKTLKTTITKQSAPFPKESFFEHLSLTYVDSQKIHQQKIRDFLSQSKGKPSVLLVNNSQLCNAFVGLPEHIVVMTFSDFMAQRAHFVSQPCHVLQVEMPSSLKTQQWMITYPKAVRHHCGRIIKVCGAFCVADERLSGGGKLLVSGLVNLFNLTDDSKKKRRHLKRIERWWLTQWLAKQEKAQIEQQKIKIKNSLAYQLKLVMLGIMTTLGEKGSLAKADITLAAIKLGVSVPEKSIETLLTLPTEQTVAYLKSLWLVSWKQQLLRESAEEEFQIIGRSLGGDLWNKDKRDIDALNAALIVAKGGAS
jgi:hypothetical protein